MKKAKKIQNKEAYSSPEIDAFLALEETINTDYIRTSMLLAAQIEDTMRNIKTKKPLPKQEAAFLIKNTEGVPLVMLWYQNKIYTKQKYVLGLCLSIRK
jgi:hypothetical protein